MQDQETDRAGNGFSLALAQVRNGELVHECSTELSRLVQAIRDTGKGGKLVLTVSIKPLTKGDGAAVMVDAEVEAKVPKPDKKMAIFFTGDDNSLQREDPNQAQLPLKVVTGGQKEEPLKKVAAN